MSAVNDVALTSGTLADELGDVPPPLELGVEPPDELLPHAEAINPAPSSAAANARLLVIAKVFLHRRAGPRRPPPGRRYDAAILQSGGRYGGNP
jgi:hypothetical protein